MTELLDLAIDCPALEAVDRMVRDTASVADLQLVAAMVEQIDRCIEEALKDATREEKYELYVVIRTALDVRGRHAHKGLSLLSALDDEDPKKEPLTRILQSGARMQEREAFLKRMFAE